MVELAQWQNEFQALGVEVAAISYDSLEILAAFHEAKSLGYPLLADVDAQHVKAFGALNEQYGEEHRMHGIPHPGIVYLSADNIVKLKFAVPGYRERPPLEEVRNQIKASQTEDAGTSASRGSGG